MKIPGMRMQNEKTFLRQDWLCVDMLLKLLIKYIEDLITHIRFRR